MIDVHAMIDAIGRHLQEAGVAYWPGPDQPYTNQTGLPPVFAKRLPETPETCLAVNVYGIELEPDPATPTVIVRFQIRCRAPLDADPVADRALNALHGVHHQAWASLPVARVTHLSTVQLGADPQTGLDERTDNYQLITN